MNRLRIFFPLIIFSVLLSFFGAVTAAVAGEEALYEPAPPADAAFVRVVDLSDDDFETINVSIDGKSFAPTSKGVPLSDYFIIMQGDREVKAGKTMQVVNIEAGKYYTIVANVDKESGATKIHVMDDALIENPAKAVIYFYNLSDAASASLTVPARDATVFDAVEQNKSTSREINALTLEMLVKADGQDVKALEDVTLTRKEGTSIFLTGSKDKGYHVFVTGNKVSR